MSQYWPFYCEENIWHLSAEADDGVVLIVTNPARAVAIWCQREAVHPAAPVVWDYHVVLVQPARHPAEPSWTVRDLDTLLESPTPLDTYLQASFRPDLPLSRAHRPQFRVLAAHAYRSYFSSDREHMRGDDGWLAPPPPWPPIYSRELGNTLESLLDLERSDPGVVCTLSDLEAALVRHRG